MAFVLLAFVVWCSSTALAWGTMPPLLNLAFFVLVLGAGLGTLGDLASHHRWRGDRPGELLRLGSSILSGSFLVLLLAHLVLTGQRAWLWWAVFVLALSTVVVVAGRYYGADDGPRPDDCPLRGATAANKPFALTGKGPPSELSTVLLGSNAWGPGSCYGIPAPGERFPTSSRAVLAPGLTW